MRAGRLLIVLLIFLFNRTHAQQLGGMVMAGNERVSGAIIHNITQDGHAVSNVRGEFYISTRAGDTLLTSKPDYLTDTLIITSQQAIIIYLNKPANQLKEVVINGSRPSPQTTYEQNKKDFKQIYRIGDNSHIVALTPLGPGIRIDPLYSALSKQGRNARKLQRTITTDYKEAVIDRRFTPTLVTRITGYTGDQLRTFMLTYRPTYELIIKANDYELVQYIKRTMKIYNEEKGTNEKKAELESLTPLP